MKQLPFRNTSSTDHFFSHEGILETLNTIYYSFISDENLVTVIGKPGTGKSYLYKVLQQNLPNEIYLIHINNPDISSLSLVKHIIDEFNIPYIMELDANQLIRLLRQALCEIYAQQRIQIAIYIDDAHRLPDESLNMIATLAGFEVNKRKLLHLVLAGDENLEKRIKGTSFQSLHQKTGFVTRLKNFSREETIRYLAHQARYAGKSESFFSKGAIDCICSNCEGNPRLINRTSKNAMLIAFGEQEKRVLARHVINALKEDKETTEYDINKILFYTFVSLTAISLTGFAGLLLL